MPTTLPRKSAEYSDAAKLKFFERHRVAGITTPEVERYVAWRQQVAQNEQRKGRKKVLANSTIYRELAMLTKMLRFAYENNKLLRLPVIRKLKEPAPRSGFFERDAYEAVRRRLPADYQLVIAIEHVFGWPCQSEVLTLEMRQIDLEAGTIRLRAGRRMMTDGSSICRRTSRHRLQPR
jgi:integrase